MKQAAKEHDCEQQRAAAAPMTKETIINCRVTLDAFLVILDQIL